jgi:hypothetical protein
MLGALPQRIIVVAYSEIQFPQPQTCTRRNKTLSVYSFIQDSTEVKQNPRFYVCD